MFNHFPSCCSPCVVSTPLLTNYCGVRQEYGTQQVRLRTAADITMVGCPQVGAPTRDSDPLMHKYIPFNYSAVQRSTNLPESFKAVASPI
jgi:hypothetical protein